MVAMGQIFLQVLQFSPVSIIQLVLHSHWSLIDAIYFIYVSARQGFSLKFGTYTGCTQKNGAVSKGKKEFISHFTGAQRTPSAVATVQVSHALPAVRFSCSMRGRGASFQDGVAAGKGFLCAPF